MPDNQNDLESSDLLDVRPVQLQGQGDVRELMESDESLPVANAFGKQPKRSTQTSGKRVKAKDVSSKLKSSARLS